MPELVRVEALVIGKMDDASSRSKPFTNRACERPVLNH